jgi:hypothetical protein
MSKIGRDVLMKKMDTQTKITSSAIGKIYKMGKTNNSNMLPSDPSGSLDESLFSENTLIKSVHKYVLLSKKDFDEVPLG